MSSLSPQEWAARLLIERSTASLSPSLAYHLVGAKKIQQSLASPGALEQSVYLHYALYIYQLFVCCLSHLFLSSATINVSVIALFVCCCLPFFSFAIYYPCISYSIVCLFVNRFVSDPKLVARMRSTFAGLYALDKVCCCCLLVVYSVLIGG